MNDQHDGSELPELSDDDVRLLYNICQRASGSPHPPFKALFSAYDAILREEDIEQEHDGVIFRALLRVGESTVEANKKRQHVDLVERLEGVLEARGITLIREDGQEEYTGTVRSVEQRKKLGRRVSFDDARLEETWLSEHSEAVNPPSPPAQPPHSLLSLPPRRARHANTRRRARSTSSQRSVVRRPAPKLFRPSSSQDNFSAHGDLQSPTLHFEVSQTQLDINADAMLAISEVRLQRRVLHFLHDQTLQKEATHKQLSAQAVNHDRRILLKQAVETWRGALLEQQYERRHEQHFQHLERKAERARDLFLITKAFTHWATQCSDERFRTRIAQHYVLRAKYFKRWRAIAIDNQAKIRRILCRKYLAIWREKTLRRSTSESYADAWYNERLMRRCKLSLFWEFCSRQVEGNHDIWVKRRALARLRTVLGSRREAVSQAQQLLVSRRRRQALGIFGTKLDRREQDDLAAVRHYDRLVCSKAIWTIRIDVKLAPLLRTFQLKVDLDLERKAFDLWYRTLEQDRQARAIRRRMLLLNFLTFLNDECRHRRFRGEVNERLKGEAFYRLYLHSRCRLHKQVSNNKLCVRILRLWRAKAHEERNQIDYAQAVFAEAQNRRRQRAGLVALNLALRQHEDGERAAIEFRNSRDVPQIFGWMRDKHEKLQRLESWAQMAKFYRLGTKTLRTWSERTTEHKANRRRDAYARVRTRVKIRIVHSCFARWRDETAIVVSMNAEAARRAEGRVVNATTGALVKWRDSVARVAKLEGEATRIDRDRLLRSAFETLIAQASERAALQDRLEQSDRATDLALLASALRRLLWQSFRAARNRESAEALRLRNRDTHAKQMLRHWAAQTAARRLPAAPPPPPPSAADDNNNRREDDPESPSLRPASRVASRASAATTPATLPHPHALFTSPPQRSGISDGTPAYLRTPSRSRRAGRFRPIPTPAAVTPFALAPGYLATTPAPLPFPSTAAANAVEGMEGLTPQVTPFGRKLRAGGFGVVPPSALRGSLVGGGGAGGGAGGGTGKSVRFAGSGGRFGRLKGS